MIKFAKCIRGGVALGHCFNEGELYPVVGWNNGVHIGFTNAQGDPSDIICLNFGETLEFVGDIQDGTIPPLFAQIDERAETEILKYAEEQTQKDPILVEKAILQKRLKEINAELRRRRPDIISHGMCEYEVDDYKNHMVWVEQVSSTGRYHGARFTLVHGKDRGDIIWGLSTVISDLQAVLEDIKRKE